MKTNLVKFISLMLALVTVFSFASCNGKTPDNDGKPNNSTQTTAPECEHSYTDTVTKKPKALADGIKTFTCSLCGHSYEEAIPMTKSLKILAIGNSFSSDAVEYLFDICKSGGVTEVIIGNLYIGGCTLDTHRENISKDLAKYKYYTNTEGRWKETPNTKVSTAITQEKWDVITVQQASGSSGVPSTYSKLPYILDYVTQSCPNADIYWHMTWAYQQNSTHNEFPKYSSNQQTMYSAIVNTTKSQVLTQSTVDGVIPSGTAIQNLRTSYIGDTLTRDGYHMSYDIGRYTVALTWFATLTGASPEAVSWVPADYGDIITKRLDPIREAVVNAVKTPYEVTSSKITKDPSPAPSTDADDAALFAANGLDITKYKAFEWVPTVASFYNSNNGLETVNHSNSTASNIPNFISSRLIYKNELPEGSVIIVDNGYQYRPEGWVDEAYKANGNRPGNVSTNFVKVTDSWWGSFTIRGFNLSAKTAKTMTEEDAVHFRIYVPV